MSSRIGALVMAALLVLYLVFVTQYAIILMSTGNGYAITISITLTMLPIIST